MKFYTVERVDLAMDKITMYDENGVEEHSVTLAGIDVYGYCYCLEHFGYEDRFANRPPRKFYDR
jgi:hypothetical protein